MGDVKRISSLFLLCILFFSACIQKASGAGVHNVESFKEAPTEIFVVERAKDVADLALRGGDFSAWNYGRGIFLEVGYFIGLYDTHPGASLVRFNVTGLEAGTVISAKFRIYKPKSMSQQGPVEVSIYKVSDKNGDWVEGGSTSREEPAASTWLYKSNGLPWTGEAGCSKQGIDYETPALFATQTVNPETSGWIEFDLPAELVQSWLVDPKNNTGLYIRGQKDPDLADEAHFCSSEHPSGKGPQLIIKASKGTPKTAKQDWAWNPQEFFPPVNSLEYARWKKHDSGRYHTWATGPEMNMTKEQGLWPYYWDTQIRVNTLAECFIPLAKNLSNLKKYMEENDDDAIHSELDEVRLHLLRYEDVKSMRIHQAGPVADELTSIQLGTMLGKEGFGVHARHGVQKYAHKSEEEIEKQIKKQVRKYSEEWKLTDSQAKIMTKYIREYEGSRWHHANETGKWMRAVQGMLAEGQDSKELFDAARRLFYNHKLFVYWLSDFNTPKWNLWLNVVKVAPTHVAQEFLNARDDNYRIEKYDLEIPRIRPNYWYPPILYVNPIDKELMPNGFGTRTWPFNDINEAIKVAHSGTEIRVVGDIDDSAVNLMGKKLIISDGYNSTFNLRTPAENSGTKNKKSKKDKKEKISEGAREAEKARKKIAKNLDPKSNLKLLNRWEDQPASVQSLYKSAYKAFATKPLEASYADLAKDAEFMRIAGENETTHLGGPMLGSVTPYGAKVWIRTLQSANVEVRVTVNGVERSFGPVHSTPETDLAAIVPVSGLKPGTRNPYRVLVDGKPVSIPEHASINTTPDETQPAKVRIAFGSCPHQWGLGNHNQSDLIRSREPAAMLLLGDIAVQDRDNNVGIHRADYLLRDFLPPWQNLVASVPVYATWDDHDYFDNDLSGIPEGFTKEDKEKVWKVFRHAWNNPSYGFGEEQKGVFLRTRIGPCDIIMTDNRYFRSGEEGSFLGEEQMKWLEEQLLDCTGPFIILSCGTMWSDYVSGGKDSWGRNDPAGREKIFNLIEKNNIGGVLLVSGDRHGARGFRIPRPSGFNFYEFEPASLGGRTGPPPSREDWGTQLYGYSGVYAFGEFTFDASLPDPEATFRLVKEDGTILHELTLTHSQLTPK